MKCFKRKITATYLRHLAASKRIEVSRSKVLAAYHELLGRVLSEAKNGRTKYEAFPAKYYEYEVACRLFSRKHKDIFCSWHDVYLEQSTPSERVKFVFDWSATNRMAKKEK